MNCLSKTFQTSLRMFLKAKPQRFHWTNRWVPAASSEYNGFWTACFTALCRTGAACFNIRCVEMENYTKIQKWKRNIHAKVKSVISTPLRTPNRNSTCFILPKYVSYILKLSRAICIFSQKHYLFFIFKTYCFLTSADFHLFLLHPTHKKLFFSHYLFW